MKVAQVFKRLTGPILAGAKLETVGESGPPRVREVLPAELPDLYEGNQLVVLGKYIGEAPLQFRLSGNYLGASREFAFNFDMSKATQRNTFVPRSVGKPEDRCIVRCHSATGCQWRSAHGRCGTFHRSPRQRTGR